MILKKLLMLFNIDLIIIIPLWYYIIKCNNGYWIVYYRPHAFIGNKIKRKFIREKGKLLDQLEKPKYIKQKE